MSLISESHDSVYEGLLGTDPSHWAFGTGFHDPLEGVDLGLPEGVDARDVAEYALLLGDDALVLSHRLSEWCSRAPDLEDDIALSNIALDLLGQARLLLSRAAAADRSLVPVIAGSPAPPEDLLAFYRHAPTYRSSSLAAIENGDFAHTVVRLLLWSCQRMAVLQDLRTHPDGVLAAVGAKGVKEVAYHRDWAGRWVVTLAQGTDESSRRLLSALVELWPAYGALLERHPDEAEETEAVVAQVLAAAGIERPAVDVGAEIADDLPLLLADMQSVARAHPQGQW